LRQFTAVAGRAAEFSAMFNAKFEGGLHGPASFRIDLTAPVGPSTAGGKQALQHIRLVPVDGSAAIVIGSVSQPENTAEIRTFRHLAEIHARRFKGARVPIDVNAYRELNRVMHAFFVQQGFAVVLVDVTDAPASTYPPSMQGGGAPSQTPWIIAGMAVAAAIGVAFIAFLASQKRAAEPPPPPPAVTAAPSAR
jgi:hypothetical protein